ncbi:MAG: WecB/TagA/CpsF family glycosyltransferase [Caulobacteraceae bacterium]|nr:WecB/TagA/CpsF family glycosyltransferase [Caulobacter sp.]
MPARGLTFGQPLSPLTRAELVQALLASAPAGEGAQLLVTMNLDHVVRLQRDAAFRAAYARAFAVTADGAPVFAWARLRGAAPPERAVGSDLLEGLMQAWAPGRHRPFFVVSRPETGAKLAALLAARGFAPADVGWASPPFGFEHEPAAGDALAAAVRGHRATHLIMGVGAPKSEIWVDRRRGELGDLWACGFGSAADFVAGQARRAPEAWRRAGLEWLWRLAAEPRRLARRYLWDSWAVVPALARDVAGRPRA